jgi:hypothetical protein
MLMLSGKFAATMPEANIKESPVIKGTNAPISSPVPAKTKPQTTATNSTGPIWAYQDAISVAKLMNQA